MQTVLAHKKAVNVCICLQDDVRSDWFLSHCLECNDTISKIIGVEDWQKVDYSKDIESDRKWDGMLKRCGVTLIPDNSLLMTKVRITMKGLYRGSGDFGGTSLVKVRTAGNRDDISVLYGSTGKLKIGNIHTEIFIKDDNIQLAVSVASGKKYGDVDSVNVTLFKVKKLGDNSITGIMKNGEREICSFKWAQDRIRLEGIPYVSGTGYDTKSISWITNNYKVKNDDHD